MTAAGVSSVYAGKHISGSGNKTDILLNPLFHKSKPINFHLKALFDVKRLQFFNPGDSANDWGFFDMSRLPSCGIDFDCDTGQGDLIL